MPTTERTIPTGPQPPLRESELLARIAEKEAGEDAVDAADLVRHLDDMGDADALIVTAALAYALRRSGVHDWLIAVLESATARLDVAMKATDAAYDSADDLALCAECNGSGEGRADRTTCRACRGEGEI